MLAGRPGQLLVMVTWRVMAPMEVQWEKRKIMAVASKRELGTHLCVSIHTT